MPTGKFLGLNHEAIFYDPEALVEPVRIIRNYVKLSGFEEGDPYVFIDCVQTIFPVKGKATPVSPGHRDPVRSARHVRPPVGADLGASTSSRAWRSRKLKTSSPSNKFVQVQVSLVLENGVISIGVETSFGHEDST